MQFATIFPDLEIVYAVSRQLTWTHFRALIYIEDPLKRDFYIEMCKLEHWSTRTLKERINSLLFERTAISQKTEETIQNEQKLSPDLAHKIPNQTNYYIPQKKFIPQKRTQKAKKFIY